MAEQNQGGRNDRDTIAAGQEHEVDYVAEKMNVSRQEVLDAIKRVGNKREDVYEELRRGGSNSGGGGNSGGGSNSSGAGGGGGSREGSGGSGGNSGSNGGR